jgi:anti-sigma factor RsiW
MHCSKALRQLQLYIDNQLTLEQIRVLEAHLSSCHVCQNELYALEKMGQALRTIEFVAEPADLTTNIMRRVALSPRRIEKPAFIILRPSFSELLSVFCLATIATLGVILGQPSLRAALPFGGIISMVWGNAWGLLVGSNTINSGTFMLGLWIVGTILGIWITLAFVGNEMRSQWLKAVMDRLPVW